MLASILLAAGRARRFGGDKLLALWKGAPLLHASLAAAFAPPVARVHLVVAPGGQAIADAAREWAMTQSVTDRLEIVVARESDEGMAASLRAGVASVMGTDATGAFVFLADMPAIPLSAPALLAAALQAPFAAVAPVSEGRAGHPVLFARAAFDALLALKGDVGAKSVLAALGERARRVPVNDPGIFRDVDRPEDLEPFTT